MAEDALLWDELNHEDEKEQAQHHLKRTKDYYSGLLSPIKNKLSNAVQHAISTIKTPSDQQQQQHVPPNSAFSGYYGYKEIKRKGSTSYEYQPPSLQCGDADDDFDYDELLPFATTATNTTAPPSPTSDGDKHHQDQEDQFFVVENFKRPQGWGAVADLDSFFASVYNYYYRRGLNHIIGKGLLELLSLFFTLALSVVLFAYLDWKALFQCRDELSCHENFVDYVISKPFSKFTLGNFILVVYCLCVTVYGILDIFRFYATVKDGLHAKSFYENKLGISARTLEGGAVEWDHIVQKIMKLQESGEYRIAIHGESELDALSVAQRILRKENFLVAFINQNILDLRLPSIFSRLFSSSTNSNYYLCTSMEWSLYACMLNHFYNRQHKIRPAFYMDPSTLRRRFILAGAAHAVFMPFLLFFMTLHFLLLNMYVWRSSKQYLGPREWSATARWKFREFNELPHIFERRLGPSYKAGEDYLNLFSQSALVSYIGRALVFLSGSIIAVLLSFAAINDAILLQVKISQWNLLWYVGMLGVAFSVGKGMLPNEEIHPPYSFNLHAEMESALSKVAVHTHYFPDTWRKRSWKRETQSEVSALLQHKSSLFASEIISTLLAPFVLCFSLPRCATNICAFVHKTKVDLPGLGEICGYSCFDFDAFQDENWEGRQLGAARVEDEAHSFILSNDRPKTRQGKMEKSFFSFKASHPSWQCNNESGKNLVEHVERFRKQEALALEAERQLYIEAAVRQLQALRSYERNVGEHHPTLVERQTARISASGIDENYVTLSNKDQEELVSSAERAAGHGGHGVRHDSSPMNLARIHHSSELYSSDQRRVAEDLSESHNLTPLQSGSFQRNLHQSNHPFLTAMSPLSSARLSPESLSSDRNISYNDQSLSTELRTVLEQSFLEPGLSIADISLGKSAAMMFHPIQFSRLINDQKLLLESTAEEQYKCLERYHMNLFECAKDEKSGKLDIV